jgi:hypothetical protein
MEKGMFRQVGFTIKVEKCFHRASQNWALKSEFCRISIEGCRLLQIMLILNYLLMPIKLKKRKRGVGSGYVELAYHDELLKRYL